MLRIVRVPFTGSVKLRSLLLKAGPGDQTPQRIVLVSKPRRVFLSLRNAHLVDRQLQFANEPSFDFDDVSDKNPTQEFEVAVGREVGEYAVRYVLVSS